MRATAHVVELLASLLLLPLAWASRLRPGHGRKVVVQGWYGSETVGDVAILGQILEEWRQALPGARLMVSSFRPRITARTLGELGRGDVRLLRMGWASAWHQLTARVLVFGGGPLMESRSSPFLALRAALARLAGARVAVHGCGVGPLHGRVSRGAVGAILRLAEGVILRDRRSAEAFPALTARRPPLVSFDPAFDYVRDLSPAEPVARPAEGPLLALVLRSPPEVFLRRLGEERERSALGFAATVGAALERVAAERGARFAAVVMHADYPESDDRAIYRRLAERVGDRARLEGGPEPPSLAAAVAMLATADAALTVRFHGLVFCLALGKPFLAIDYTVPAGKTTAAAEEAGAGSRVLPWTAVTPALLSERLIALLDEAASAPRLPAALPADLAARRVVFLRERFGID